MYTGLRSNTAKLSLASTSTSKSDKQDQAKLLPGNCTNNDILDNSDEDMIDTSDAPGSPVLVTQQVRQTLPATPVQATLSPNALGPFGIAVHTPSRLHAVGRALVEVSSPSSLSGLSFFSVHHASIVPVIANFTPRIHSPVQDSIRSSFSCFWNGSSADTIIILP